MIPWKQKKKRTVEKKLLVKLKLFIDSYKSCNTVNAPSTGLWGIPFSKQPIKIRWSRNTRCLHKRRRTKWHFTIATHTLDTFYCKYEYVRMKQNKCE